MRGGQRLVHPVQFRKITPGRRAGATRELEVDVQVHTCGIEAAQVFPGDVAHPRIVCRRIKRGLIRRVAAIQVRAALVGDELDIPPEAALPRSGQRLVFFRPLQGGGDIGPRVGQHPIDSRRSGIGRPLPVGRSDVGGDRDGVKGTSHALDDPVRHPVDGRPACRHADEPIGLAHEHIGPDVEIPLRLVAGDLPVIEPGVCRQPCLLSDPLRALESPAKVPDFI